MDSERHPSASCSSCGGADIRLARVRSAFWHDERLVVVEDVPALVCAGCGAQSLDDAAVVVLDLLRGEGFPAEKARREITVPVFSFRDRAGPEGGS